ncbi:hypothetical protein FRUB_03670 [Fimbriiglobus ruber]|uniref:Uncharacterized protein n=1 Tax=Fimbriiglobus ruber TaxID=1908690 RepID=A0A225DJL5_9BACT|nr:hypothetical protein FRUB_03670 [Fimbriiglobus ruber]
MAVLAVLVAAPAPAADLPGFRKSVWFGESVREEWVGDGVRVLANAPAKFDPTKPTRLVVFATPNGNTIEQTLGCGPAAGLDWHFDIQHVAAQVRKLRTISPEENIVLVCTEAEGLSWPAWKRKFKDGPARVRKIVEAVRTWVPGDNVRISLAGHSGGGSFLFGYLDGADAIPDAVDRVVGLDANYSYSDADKHGDKLLAWLKGDPSRRLVVIAYDDRNVMVNGKPVVGADGGTFRATGRMQARFARDMTFAETTTDDITTRTALDGRLALIVHANPKNRILHTALVGEMNGLLRGLTDPAAKPVWGTFGGPRAYTEWVQPAPGIPKRPADAVGGTAFFQTLDGLTPAAREEAIEREILRGNIPDFLRAFRRVTVKAKDAAGKEHTATFEVMPDYLAVGSDADFVRVPMTPMTAARIADAFGCALPTRKVVDEVYRAASVKWDPKPMTEARESPATFLRHNTLIKEQLAGEKPGELVAGVKKDIVITNRLAEKSNRVAIYGWHKPDGKAIQPLTIVHRDTYVDYSHGVRLMSRTVTVDGKPRDVRHVLYAADLCSLLSDEGPILRPAY